MTCTEAEDALNAIALPITWTPDGRDIWPGESATVDGTRYIVFKREEGVYRAGKMYNHWLGEFPTIEDAKRAVLTYIISNITNKTENQ